MSEPRQLVLAPPAPDRHEEQSERLDDRDGHWNKAQRDAWEESRARNAKPSGPDRLKCHRCPSSAMVEERGWLVCASCGASRKDGGR